jgi:cell division septation protein DedD
MVDTRDDGFHEIQLNGKQLVFLFMAATVVSVVIFLLGVLFGRGVRAERDASVGSVATDTTPQQAAVAPAPTSAGSDPTMAAPPPAVDELSYFNRLEKPNAPDEQLKAAPSRAAVARPAAPASVEKAAPAAAREAPAPQPAKKDAAAVRREGAKDEAAGARVAPAPEASAEPAGQGYAVQVAALNVRSEAEGIARRLSSKGYPAYVMSPASGTPMVFRVRVGKFSSRREAETIAAKLQKEEQFKPWITR